jgi:hypothetical protein
MNKQIASARRYPPFLFCVYRVCSSGVGVERGKWEVGSGKQNIKVREGAHRIKAGKKKIQLN